MAKVSAGLMMFRRRSGTLEVLLVHLGGPFWKKKDNGSWTIPKGELDPGEDALTTAKREFAEETGLVAHGEFISLGEVKQKGGKLVHAWAFEGDCDPKSIRSRTIEIAWPPKSGRKLTIPEIDRGDFFPLAVAREKINAAQVRFLETLQDLYPTESND